MKFRIYFTLKDGHEDSVIIEESTLEKVKEAAMKVITEREALDPWSINLD